MADLPPPLNSGDTLTVRWLNALLAVVRTGLSIVAGPGISITRTNNGFSVGLANVGIQERFKASITAVQLGAPPPATAPAGSAVPSTTLYTAQSKYYQFDIGPVVPTLGRPVRNDEFVIWPAAVGDECDIVRRTAADGSVTAVLHIFTEAIAGRRCTPH